MEGVVYYWWKGVERRRDLEVTWMAVEKNEEW